MTNVLQWEPSGQGGLPISVGVERDQLVVWLEGEVDAANADVLPAAVLASVSGDRGVIVDLGGVTFMDSNGVRALLRCEAKLAQEAIGFRVRNASRAIVRLFDLTRTEHLLENPAQLAS